MGRLWVVPPLDLNTVPVLPTMNAFSEGRRRCFARRTNSWALRSLSLSASFIARPPEGAVAGRWCRRCLPSVVAVIALVESFWSSRKLSARDVQQIEVIRHSVESQVSSIHTTYLRTHITCALPSPSARAAPPLRAAQPVLAPPRRVRGHHIQSIRPIRPATILRCPR